MDRILNKINQKKYLVTYFIQRAQIKKFFVLGRIKKLIGLTIG